MTSHKRKKILYFEITREERDDTKGLRGLLTTSDVLATYSDRARTGHNNSSSAKPATKSEIGWKSEREGAHRSPNALQKLRKEAGSSLTLLADARVTKKKVYRVKSRRENWCKGSKTGDVIYSNTFKRTQGGLTELAGASTRKDWHKPWSTREVEISGHPEQKPAEINDLYPILAETSNF